MIASAPSPTRPGKIIIALPAGEEHEVAPLMLNLLLRYTGWDVVYLGANVPIIQLESTLERTNPEMVILSAHLLPAAASLLETAAFINKYNIPLAFGGAIFNRLPQIRERIPGFFIGEDVEEAVRSVETIILQKLPTPTVQAVPPQVRRTQSAFQTNLADIEALLQQKMRDNDISLSALNCYNNYFAEYINAALSLGDLHYASRDIQWVKHPDQPPQPASHGTARLSDGLPGGSRRDHGGFRGTDIRLAFRGDVASKISNSISK